MPSSDFIGVGLLERFEDSMILLDQWLGGNVIPGGNFRDNSAPSNKIKTGLMRDPQILNAIEEMNVEDKKLYAFMRDKQFPAQIHTAEKSDKCALVDKRRAGKKFLPGCRERVFDAKRVLLYKPARKLQDLAS